MLLANLLALALAAAAPPADTAHLVVVATTDVHGHATAWDYAAGRAFPGGLSRAATVVDSLRARFPGQVVVVDAGDMIEGDAFAEYYARVAPKDPHPIVEAMNLIGYDAATPGNHDFDFGLPLWHRAMAAAAFPLVSGNLFDQPADTLLLPPFVVFRRAGVRVAVAGFTTPGTMVWDREQLSGRLRVARIGAEAAPIVAQMRRQADVSIILAHSGLAGRSSYDTTGVGGEHVAELFAHLTVRPDLVVVGHSHQEIADSTIGGVHFVQPKYFAESVTVTHIILVGSDGHWRVTSVRSDLVPLAREPPETRLTGRLRVADSTVRAYVSQPLGVALGAMPAKLARVHPTALLGFIGSVERQITGAQLAAVSAFDLSAGFDSGAIRLSDIAAVYPYENTLRAVRISGDQLKRYLEQSARYFKSDSTGWVAINDSVRGYNYDVVTGAHYLIDLTRPVGDRIQELSVAGAPVAPADSFTLAVNSYRQAGGGGYDMLAGAPVVYDHGEDIRGLLAEAIRRVGRIDPAEYRDSSWAIVPQHAADQVEALFGVSEGIPSGTRLRILAITDLHGALLSRAASIKDTRQVGGVAVLAATMDSLEARCGCATVRVDAGDEMQGTLISNLRYGVPVVEALDRLGLQAAAVGNHDLDWTIDTLRARMAEARYPWLVANLVDSASGRRPDWAIPSTVVKAGGLRVGLIGYLTPGTKSMVKAANLAGIRIDSGAAALREPLAALRAEHPDAIVLLAHAGAVCDSAACTGEILDLVRELGPGAVDAVVAGHTHRTMALDVSGVPLVEAGSSGLAVGVRRSDPYAARLERSRRRRYRLGRRGPRQFGTGAAGGAGRGDR